MSEHLNSKISQEIKQAVLAANLPLYNGGPGFDYTNSDFAYALDILLLHAPNMLTINAETLLVQRSSGHGIIGSWSGVSGYIDTIKDPAQNILDSKFDPILYTAKTELKEECGLDDKIIDSINFILAKRFKIQKFGGGILHVMPIVGIYTQPQRPTIIPYLQEISDHKWVQLNMVKQSPDLSPNYLSHTLPIIIKSLGLTA